MSFLDIALEHAVRGWYVFPCTGKRPLTAHGFKDASKDPVQLRAWWIKWPGANVAIACGASGIAVFDIDHGIQNAEGFVHLCAAMNLPVTYTVRTGRRDDYGVQVYFSGVVDDVGDFRIHGCNGQIKSRGGYVMAAGCVHPVSGELYQALQGDAANLAPLPDNVRELKTYRPPVTHGPMEKIPEGAGRHAKLMSVAGKLRASGLDQDAILSALTPLNPAMCEVPISDDDLEHLAESACRYPIPEKVPDVTFGSNKEKKNVITDWRELFHNRDAMLNAPPVTFLIKGFLQREGVTAIAAPVRERKSLIALNVVHALLTGEKLFDYFDVAQKPNRVLYLCPEVSLGPFTDRLRKIGLMDYVGETLFCRTLSADGHLTLDAPELQPALPGSVVVLDTAIRFMEGDESSSQDARVFADSIFALLKGGAESVVMLHHSPKEGGDTMTLENIMRGSGDLGAFLACCWGTRLQDPQRPYESRSYLENLKQRDFESQPFEVTCGPDCRMRIVGDPSIGTVKLQTRRGNKGNKDGKDAAAEAVIRANISMSARELEEQLAALEIDRRKTWIAKAQARIKAEMGISGVQVGAV